MKGIQAQYPYNDYYLYIVFHKNEGRRYANLIPIDKTKKLKRKTISYARYLMSVKEKRILNKNEEVDHIDDDRTHDDISNLQILTREENLIKEAKRKGKQFVLLKCPCCGRIFEKYRGATHLVKGGTFTSCSRKCSGTFGAILYNHPNDATLLNALKNNIIKEYTKHE